MSLKPGRGADSRDAGLRRHGYDRHCERSEAIRCRAGLPRGCAPRNDGAIEKMGNPAAIANISAFEDEDD